MTDTAPAKEKAILIDLGYVRIREYDSLNVQIERLEEVFNPINKETSRKWKFKGYSSTIFSALQSVVKNELLIDRSLVNGLKDYLEKVEAIHMKIDEVLKEES